jgi:hypothetical protein
MASIGTFNTSQFNVPRFNDSREETPPVTTPFYERGIGRGVKQGVARGV